MGIYDREYYRKEGPSFLESIATEGKVCKWLILINVIAFVIQLMTRQRDVPEELERLVRHMGLPLAGNSGPFTEWLILNVQSVWHGQIWRLVTYAFLHDTNTFWHIAFNMLFLWWFGKDVEDLYGPREFLAFYLASALAGGLAFEAGWLTDATPGAQLCLGASGAVTAVMVLCAFHYPSRLIYIWFFPIPIWLFVGFQVASDLFGFLGNSAGGTAVTVHLGGAAFAYVYFKMNWRMLNFLPDLRAWKQQRARPSLRVYRAEEEELPLPRPVPATAQPTHDPDEHLEAKVDAVLEKMARTGKESLTEGERQLLLRLSEVYKKRRS